MGHRCCGKQKVKRGLWSPEEDEKLVGHITTHGHASWSSVPKLAGLQRCGKSCRLRWINYLRPDLKRGSFTAEEEQIIIDVHRILGNRWAHIAKHLPGRTDNEVKNFWNSCIKKKLISQGLDPRTHNLMPSHKRASASNNKATSNNIKILSKSEQLHIQQDEQIPIFSIITVNSQSTKDSFVNTRDSSMNINPPFISATLAPPPSPPDDNDHHQSVVTCYDQNPIQFQCPDQTNDFQNRHDPFIFTHESPNQTIPHIDPSLAPYFYSSVNTTMSGLLDENHSSNTWGPIEITDEPFQAPTNQTQEQGEEQMKEMAIDGNVKLSKKGSGQYVMDISFDSTSFDLDFAALMSNDFNPMDDFAWTF